MFRWILIVFAIVASAAASRELQLGHLETAIQIGGIALFLGILIVVEAEKVAKSTWAALMDATKNYKSEKTSIKTSATAGRISKQNDGLAPALTVSNYSLLKSLVQMPKSIAVPWAVILGLAIALAALGQYYVIFVGSLIAGLAIDGLALILALRWFQRSADEFQINLLATLPQFIGSSVLALALWLLGGYLIWHENETATYIGVLITWLGTGLGAWGCLKFIEKPLAKSEIETSHDKDSFSFFDLAGAGQDWVSALRFPLLGVALLLLLAMSAVTTYILSIGLMVGAIIVFLFATACGA